MLRCHDSLFFRTEAPISILGYCFSKGVDTFRKLFLFVRDLEMSLSLVIFNSKPGNAGNW